MNVYNRIADILFNIYSFNKELVFFIKIDDNIKN